jgi:hypothetical protein
MPNLQEASGPHGVQCAAKAWWPTNLCRFRVYAERSLNDAVVFTQEDQVGGPMFRAGFGGDDDEVLDEEDELNEDDEELDDDEEADPDEDHEDPEAELDKNLRSTRRNPDEDDVTHAIDCSLDHTCTCDIEED